MKKLDLKKIMIIAEAGINHNGSFEIAAKMVEEASKAGADAVKFQNFKTEDFIFDKSLTFSYLCGGKKVTESMWDLCKRCELKRQWLPELKKICNKNGIAFLSTPTSNSGVNDLVKIGVSMLKNGSDFLNHVELLRYMGSTGIPVIISTGMADKAEIQDAIDAVQISGKSQVILMHCTSSYPTPIRDVNLGRMAALQEVFGLPVGFSDHTEGCFAAIQAAALNARIIEKHFTLDHSLPGPDHWFSLLPGQLKDYVDNIRDAEKRMGNCEIVPAQSEKKHLKEFKLGLIASRDLPKGRVLKKSDFVIAKPCNGLTPKEANLVTGKRLELNIKKGTCLSWEHF